ncbi:MAG: type ISP restriction/modification enzyme, partial [Ktedonobacteraceae bacterium]
DGIVCFVSNNSFVDQVAFDGMRKHLLQDFTRIYHLDLHGNVRKNPKLSGSTHNVFGIQVGVGITIAIRNNQYNDRKLYYYRVPSDWTRQEKLNFLSKQTDINHLEWQELQPNERQTWIADGFSEFLTYIPVGSKEARVARIGDILTIFKLYSGGIKTNRDNWVQDFKQEALIVKIKRFIDTYSSEINRWMRRGSNPTLVDNFVTYDDTKIKWSRDLVQDLQRGHYVTYDSANIRHIMYRPFCKKFLYFDRILNEEIYQLPHIFPNPTSEQENVVISLTDIAAEKPFMVFASNILPDLHVVGAGANAQCFPYYTYAEDGSNQRENITDWALTQFQGRYGAGVTKWDIFHYVYAMLHHPQYRERYAENLKRDLPHLPLLRRTEAYQAAVRIGQQLMDLHVHYEQVAEYGLKELEDETVPYLLARHVEKMKMSSDKTAVIVNKGLTLTGIPEVCFRYRLGNRSALEWVLDQYQVSTDARSGIRSDPNRLDDPGYIVKLVKQVVTVSVQTVALVEELALAVTLEDWLIEGDKEALIER